MISLNSGTGNMRGWPSAFPTRPPAHCTGKNFITTDPGQTDPEGSRDLEEGNIFGSLFWGMNSQLDNIVFGIEADLTVDSFDKKHDSGNITYITMPAATFAIQSRVSSEWMASIRPRLGYAFDKSLVCVSSGPALSLFDYRFKFTDTNAP